MAHPEHPANFRAALKSERLLATRKVGADIIGIITPLMPIAMHSLDTYATIARNTMLSHPEKDPRPTLCSLVFPREREVVTVLGVLMVGKRILDAIIKLDPDKIQGSGFTAGDRDQKRKSGSYTPS